MSGFKHYLKKIEIISKIEKSMSNKITIDESIIVLNDVLNELVNFDSDSEKNNFVLDVVDLYKQKINKL